MENGGRTNVWGWLASRDLRGTGVVVVVLAAMAMVLVITLVALPKVAADDKLALATGAFTLIGTLVGAYTGVRVGSRGVEQARAETFEAQREQIKALDEKAILMAELAAASDPEPAQAALDRAEEKLVQRGWHERPEKKRGLEAEEPKPKGLDPEEEPDEF